MSITHELKMILHRRLVDCSNELIQHHEVKGYVDYMCGKREALLSTLEFMDILMLHEKG